MSVDMPHLRELWIVHDPQRRDYFDPRVVIELPSEKLAGIRRLKLSPVRFRWDITGLSKLKALDPAESGPSGLPSASQVMGVFRAFLGLVELKLGHRSFDILDTVEVAPLDLLELTILLVSEDHSGAIGFLLPLIRCPRCAVFSLSGRRYIWSPVEHVAPQTERFALQTPHSRHPRKLHHRLYRICLKSPSTTTNG
ncbi:hypothetical protein FRB96_004982 [Tulasnella sp. 330]|nr:hypothetical protein FRB96_004982 [Tulasnella sp. 330]